MKRIACVLLLAAVAPTTFAQTSAELSVTGKLIPGACTISLGENLLDWSSVPVADLNESSDEGVSFAGNTKQVALDIDCSAFRRVAVRAIDAKAGTPTSSSMAGYNFGLGLDQGGGKIGHFTINSMANPIVNGAAGYNGWARADTGNSVGFGSSTSALAPSALGYLQAFSGTALANDVAVPPIKTVSAILGVSMFFNGDYKISGISDEVEGQGEITLELVYL